MRKYGIAGLVGVGLLALITVGLAHRRVTPPLTAATSVQADGGGAVIRFARNPEPAPAFLTHDLDGNVVSTASWKGKVTLLTFWATWCGPCRAEIPELVALQKDYADRLQVIGVSVDDDPAQQVKQFVKRAGINYPVVMVNQDILRGYGGVPALPTSFVLNTDARIVQKHVGLYPRAVFDQEIRALLSMPVDATIETFEDTGQIFLKNAANATELPGVDLKGLNPKQKQAALRRMNSENCNCGCNLTIAQCRINDTKCEVSRDLGNKIVKEILGGPPSGHAPSTSEQK
jgi:thiol-disulfide isomerase/thioredoxin